jgi:hypothetical protein
MNLLSKLFRRDHAYHGNGFTVRIVPGQREIVSIIHERAGVELKLGGERVGKNWKSIDVRIPEEVEASRALQVARDLEAAFQAKGLGYVISRALGTEIVPEAEREAAMTELREMGFEARVSADGSAVNTTKIQGAPQRSAEEWRKFGPRMMTLVSAARGKRPRFEILAQSKRPSDRS